MKLKNKKIIQKLSYIKKNQNNEDIIRYTKKLKEDTIKSKRKLLNELKQKNKYKKIKRKGTS